MNLKKAKANRQKTARESRKMAFLPQRALVNEGLSETIVTVPPCLANEKNNIGRNKYIRMCCGRDFFCDLA